MRARNYGKTECLTCGESFHRYNTRNSYCSEKCRCSASNKRYNAPNKKDVRRNAHLQKSFGISLEKYNEILKDQKGGCAICGKIPQESERAHAVDHCHKTGEIFGILCYHCNHKLIGNIRTADLYLKAYEYLQKGTGLFVPKKKRPVKRQKGKL